MRKALLLKRSVFFFVLIVLFLAACNNENSSQAKTDTLNTTANTTSPAVPAKGTFLTGYLDTLYIDSLNFSLLEKRLTLRFYVDTSNLLTLHGWSSDTSTFKDDPDILFLTGRKSITVKYGPGNYLGNLVLYGKDIKKIQRAYRRKYKYVLFAPVDPTTTYAQITYTILLTNDDPSPSAKSLLVNNVPAYVNTNPSPPRNSN